MGRKGNSSNQRGGHRQFTIRTAVRGVERAFSNGIAFTDGTANTYEGIRTEGTAQQLLAAAEVLVNHLAQHPEDSRSARRQIENLGGVQDQIKGTVIQNPDGTQSRVLRPGYNFDSGRGFKVAIPPILGKVEPSASGVPAPQRAPRNKVQFGRVIRDGEA